MPKNKKALSKERVLNVQNEQARLQAQNTRLKADLDKYRKVVQGAHDAALTLGTNEDKIKLLKVLEVK